MSIKELKKLKKLLLEANTPTKEDIMAEALRKLIISRREGLIGRNDFINEFSKII